MPEIPNLIDPVINSSQKLGSLTPAAIFAFMWLWQSVKEIRRESSEKDLKKQENERREQSILSEERQTEAMKDMCVNIVELKQAHGNSMTEIGRLFTILDERLPKR